MTASDRSAKSGPNQFLIPFHGASPETSTASKPSPTQRAENHKQVSLSTTVKRGVDDARRDERCVSGSENAGHNINQLFLIVMFVEAVPVAGQDDCLDDRDQFCARGGRAAARAARAPAGWVQLDLGRNSKIVVIQRPLILFPLFIDEHLR